MPSEATEIVLFNWRYGQTQSERLSAGILHVEGYSAVDPQAPLGGGDGKKDILCRKEGKLWLGAAYFPPLEKTFSEIQTKFLGDLNGVASNRCDGFVFFVNQRLTVGEREKLIAHAGKVEVQLYHLERIRGVLDSPKGYGLRLEYLRIEMTKEEQYSFFSAQNYDLTRRLLSNEKSLDSISRKLDEVLERTANLLGYQSDQPSSLSRPSGTLLSIEQPTRLLNLSMILWVHTIVTEGTNLPESSRGRLRSVKVWIGSSDPANASFQPPEADSVPQLIQEWIEWWNTVRPGLSDSDREGTLRVLAESHHRFLSIHPFLDGNGRVARVLLDQACRELFNQSVGSEIRETASEYLASLKEADRGNLNPLVLRIEAALS